MIIKYGYGDKPCKIYFELRDDKYINLWIIQEGLKKDYETLSYISLNELIELRDEINKIIKEVVNV